MRTTQDLREAITEGCGEAHPSEDDDSHGDPRRSVADHVEPRRRGGCNEADRRADDRRGYQLFSPRVGRLSCDL